MKDATDSYAIGFMLLSEIALLCLIVNVLVLQRRFKRNSQIIVRIAVLVISIRVIDLF